MRKKVCGPKIYGFNGISMKYILTPFSLTHTPFFPIVSKWGNGLSEGGIDDVCRPEDDS